MRDEYEGVAFLDHAAQGLEKVFHFLGRENGRRLVENDEAGAAVQGFQDLDALLLADRKLPHVGAGIDLEAVLLGQSFRCVRSRL